MRKMRQRWMRPEVESYFRHLSEFYKDSEIWIEVLGDKVEEGSDLGVAGAFG